LILPLKDSNFDRRITPAVNYLLVALNIIVFIFFQKLGADEEFTLAYSCVPAEIVSGKDIITKDSKVYDKETRQYYTVPGLKESPEPVYITLLTSIFMHGSIAHIFGNMLFLFIFGDNIENRIGHFRYLIFYLVCGFLASFAHILSTYMFNIDPNVPSLGASGAISGVLGGYILLFPRNRVTVLLFNFLTDVPAVFALGLWFVFQLVSGLGMLGGDLGGVAYGAHIGGFVAGFVLIKIFEIGK
jgi:membrane associated rhomboid family serine protease